MWPCPLMSPTELFSIEIDQAEEIGCIFRHPTYRMIDEVAGLERWNGESSSAIDLGATSQCVSDSCDAIAKRIKTDRIV